MFLEAFPPSMHMELPRFFFFLMPTFYFESFNTIKKLQEEEHEQPYFKAWIHQLLIYATFALFLFFFLNYPRAQG